MNIRVCKNNDGDLIEIDNLKNDINNHNINPELKATVENEMKILLQNHENVTKTRILKKLNNLYNGVIKIKETSNSYINLSNYEPNEAQKEFLNLGLNYHIQPKYDKIEKSTQLELLYQDLLKIENEQKKTINPDLPDQLRNEATKHRYSSYKSNLTPELKQAAKELYENPDIVIKKADKSSNYVLLNKQDYYDKLNNLLLIKENLNQLIEILVKHLKPK